MCWHISMTDFRCYTFQYTLNVCVHSVYKYKYIHYVTLYAAIKLNKVSHV